MKQAFAHLHCDPASRPRSPANALCSGSMERTLGETPAALLKSDALALEDQPQKVFHSARVRDDAVELRLLASGHRSPPCRGGDVRAKAG
jgi:hypothetical protein